MSHTIWVAIGAGMGLVGWLIMGLVGWLIEQFVMPKKDEKALKGRYL
jgi:hypothetical protein